MFVTTAVFPGGLCGRRGMAALEEGCRLAPVQEHLHGLVRDCAHLGPDQCRHHGHLHPWHPVSNTAATPQGTGKERTLRKRSQVRKPKYIAYLKPTTLEGERKLFEWTEIWACGSWLHYFHPRICGLSQLDHFTSSEKLAFFFLSFSYLITL